MPRPKPMVSHAQNLEDVMLERAFQDKEIGFYVDVGAADPCVWSVTRHFYDHGWRGINLEPGSLFAKVQAHRPRDINLNLAISNRIGTMTLHEYPAAMGLSTLNDSLPAQARAVAGEAIRKEVEVKPLKDVLAQHAPQIIDFMSVDVEGHERAVLASNDWDRFRPRIVLVEATVPTTPIPNHHLWEDVLLGADYSFVYFDGLNRFYVSREASSLGERFTPPPNVHDHYVLPSEEQHKRLLETCQNLEKALERQTALRNIPRLVLGKLLRRAWSIMPLAPSAGAKE